MTKPGSSILITDSGVELVSDRLLVPEPDLGVENEILGGRPVEPGSDPIGKHTITLITKYNTLLWI